MIAACHMTELSQMCQSILLVQMGQIACCAQAYPPTARACASSLRRMQQLHLRLHRQLMQALVRAQSGSSLTSAPLVMVRLRQKQICLLALMRVPRWLESQTGYKAVRTVQQQTTKLTCASHHAAHPIASGTTAVLHQMRLAGIRHLSLSSCCNQPKALIHKRL